VVGFRRIVLVGSSFHNYPSHLTFVTRPDYCAAMGSMITIGLVGGVASGKSLVAKMLVELGAGLLDADRTGHAVLAEDSEVRAELKRHWGDSVVGKDGRIDRAAVAKRVFAESDAAVADRRYLEELLHPRIRRRLNELRDQYATEDKPAVVLDAPLLLEAGWGPLCDVVLMVDVPRQTRLTRAHSRGWSEAEFARREAAQWPAEEKRRHANVVISNDGTEAELRAAVRDFWARNVVPIG
jgi:dephospho-CoA kinase